jgi:hypothetical protein
VNQSAVNKIKSWPYNRNFRIFTPYDVLSMEYTGKIDVGQGGEIGVGAKFEYFKSCLALNQRRALDWGECKRGLKSPLDPCIGSS